MCQPNPHPPAGAAVLSFAAPPPAARAVPQRAAAGLPLPESPGKRRFSGCHGYERPRPPCRAPGRAQAPLRQRRAAGHNRGGLATNPPAAAAAPDTAPPPAGPPRVRARMQPRPRSPQAPPRRKAPRCCALSPPLARGLFNGNPPDGRSLCVPRGAEEPGVAAAARPRRYRAGSGGKGMGTLCVWEPLP